MALVVSVLTALLPGRPVGAATAATSDPSVVVPPTLAVNDVSVAEGNSGTAQATFTITRSGNTSGASSVTWKTVDSGAAAPADYTAQTGATVTFPAGDTTPKQVSVAVTGDTVVEPNETFWVNLSSPSGATIADGDGLGTITNDDTALAVSDVTVPEGHSGTTQATFTITRSGNTSVSSSVTWKTADGTATVADNDYLAQTGATVTFPAGDTAPKQMAVTVNGDTVVEPTETFSVRLSAPTAATIADGTGVGRITNDDSPTLAINDVSVDEGNSGTRTATFTITRSGNTSAASSVKWNTADATAKVAGNDYVAQAGATVNFAAGDQAAPVSVTVKGDTTIEPNETFTVRLSAPTGALITDGNGVGTIVSDDTGLSINDVSVTEGNSGTARACNFTITRSGRTSGTSSVTWNTADDTATVAGNDYVAQPGSTVSFAAGQTSKVVSVPVTGDTVPEPDERLTVRISKPGGGVILDGTGVCTIFNDDALPVLAINDVTVTEGNSGTTTATFTVTRSGSTVGASSVTWATADGTAQAPGDYVAKSPTVLSFAANETTKTVPVTVNGDATMEPSETFSVKLTSPSGATIGDGSGTGTIADDDTPVPQTFQYTLGTTVTDGRPWPGAGNIEVPGAVDRYTFAASVGQRVEVNRISTTNCNLRWQLTGPGGATIIADRGFCEYEGSRSLPSDGAYTFTVNAPAGTAHTGTYHFRITSPQQFQYTLGSTVSNGQPAPGAGNIGFPGEVDQYHFYNATSQAVGIELLSASECSLVSWWITRGSGGVPEPGASQQGCGATGRITLPYTGNYTLHFDVPPNSGGTYTYSFRVTLPQYFNLGSAPVSNGQPWAGAGNIEQPGAVDHYDLYGQAGQRVFVDWMSATNCNYLRWRMTGPGGATIFPHRGCSDPGWMTVPVTGTYTISFDTPPVGGGAYTYSFRLTNESAPQVFAYTIGATVADGQPPGAGNIEVPGAVDVYAFEGSANRRVFVDWISASNCDQLRWHMTGPGGITLFPHRGCGDPGEILLPSTGSYRVVFDTPTNGDGTYTYSFRIVLADVVVPNVLELPEDVAADVLYDATLETDPTGDVGDPNAYVASQSPYPGSVVESGSTVTIELRSGPIP